VAFELLQAFILGCVASVPISIYHPGKPLRVLVHQRYKLERRWLEENLCAVMPIGRIESIEPLRGEAVPDMAVALAGATQILVPRAGRAVVLLPRQPPDLINAYDHPAALRPHPSGCKI